MPFCSHFRQIEPSNPLWGGQLMNMITIKYGCESDHSRTRMLACIPSLSPSACIHIKQFSYIHTVSLSQFTLHACMHWYILDTRTPIRTQTHMFTLHLASSNSMWLYELTMFSDFISGRTVIIQTVDAYFLLISQVTARALWWIGHD